MRFPSVIYFCLSLILLPSPWISARAETRATWLARDSLTSKETLAQAMERAAANHFNTVLVNAWSRGYPLWRSPTFARETGLWIDPSFSTRDIMAEAVAEGHRHGLQVFAWFEYGFVGGWTGYLPGSSGKGKIFDLHPDWVAQQQDGTERDASNFYWMAHTRPDVQAFLLNLMRELVTQYDLDGIELDRIRYPSLAYGYDAYTQALYATAHGGQVPPTNPSASQWIRWRADQLNAFHAAAYDTIKALYPRCIVANAPSAYSANSYSAYLNFCQDWVAWLNSQKVDCLELQSYVSTASAFSNILNYVKTQVADVSRLHPSFALRPNSVWIPYPEILKFVDAARTLGFGGQAAWYYTDLNTSNYFPNLGTNRYATPATPTYQPAAWRQYYAVLNISNATDAVRSGTWLTSANAGLAGPSLYANHDPQAAVDYYFDVPTNGVYEVYAFQVISGTRATNALFRTFDAGGTIRTQWINQTLTVNSRWNKLGEVLLAPGRHRVAQVSNEGIGSGRQVSADALLISRHQRLSRVPELGHDGPASFTNGQFRLRLVGNAGQRLRVENSSNLVHWSALGTITLTNTSGAFFDSFPEPAGARFYRAALVP